MVVKGTLRYGGTTYFPRVLKFDAIPMYADLYAAKALEIHEKTLAAKNKTTSNSDGCFTFLKDVLEKCAGFFNNSKLVQASGLLGESHLSAAKTSANIHSGRSSRTPNAYENEQVQK